MRFVRSPASVAFLAAPARVTLVAAAAALLASTAGATVPARRCGPADVAPPNGAVVPANAPSLSVDPKWAEATVTGVELRGGAADAGALPTTIRTVDREQLVTLDGGLTAGESYALHYTVGCGSGAGTVGGGTDFLGPQVSRFSVAAGAPLPVKLGKLTADVAVGVTSASPDPTTGGRARLTLTVSDELRPYLPVTRFTTLVDGVVWATGAYGGLIARASASDRSVDEVFALCVPEGAATTLYPDVGEKLGRSLVTLKAHVAGAAQDPEPLSVEIDLRCTKPVEAPADAGGDAGAVDLPTVAKPSCSCDLAARDRSPAGGVLALLTATLALTLTRRRARPRR